MTEAIFFDPADMNEGIIAEGFRRAHTACQGNPEAQNAVVASVHQWHSCVARTQCAQPQRIAAAALAAGDVNGVYAPIAAGLISVGVMSGEEAEDAGYFDTGVQLVREAGAGVKDLVLRTGAGVERVTTKAMEEAGDTVRTGPYGETAQKAAEEAGDVAKEWTTAQMVLGSTAILGAAWVVSSFFGIFD